MLKLSVIIPTLNEELFIGRTVQTILTHRTKDTELEVIVVDGGSQDKTVAIASEFGARVIEASRNGRAVQMNIGASHAKHDNLYFVHADVQVLPSYISDIQELLSQGAEIGCYRFKFDKESRSLRFNAYFTRFNRMFCRGGDQTLFVTKSFFESLNKFDESYVIMEDFDLIRRAKKKTKFHIIPKSVIVSARKYENNSYFRVNMANLTAYWMFMLRFPQEKIKRHYHTMIKHPKD